MNQAQRREAAEKLAGGISRREVAEILGVTKRSIERLCAEPVFQEDIQRVCRRLELADYHAAKKMAQRHHVPEPTHPDQVREMQAEMERARAEVLDRQRARDVGPVQTPDAAIVGWVLGRRPTNEAEYLDYRDAERGVVSGHARRRYGGSVRRPQVGQVVSIPRPAEYVFGFS